MSIVMENMRATGTNLHKWTKKKGFCYAYARKVFNDKDGSIRKSGKAKEIIKAANEDGFMTVPEEDKLIWPSDLIVDQNVTKTKGKTTK